MTQNPLVSVIVTTRNSEQFLANCLQSIQNQTYPHIELLVVDNNSEDTTKEIARKFTPQVYNLGPERSTQRNFGVSQAHGEHVLIVDADMELGPDVVAACVRGILPGIAGIVIPEESFGQGFWAQCKRLERSFYVGVPWIEAARFYLRDTYLELGGYDITLVSGEDWDLSHRAEATGNIVSVEEFIRHNEGRISLRQDLKKKFYYAQHAREYLRRNPVASKMSAQVGPIQRYKLFLSRPGKLFRNPLLGIGMLTMKTAEFAAGAVGYVLAGLKPSSAEQEREQEG